MSDEVVLVSSEQEFLSTYAKARDSFIL